MFKKLIKGTELKYQNILPKTFILVSAMMYFSKFSFLNSCHCNLDEIKVIDKGWIPLLGAPGRLARVRLCKIGPGNVAYEATPASVDAINTGSISGIGWPKMDLVPGRVRV